jgi:hypothetical protein
LKPRLLSFLLCLSFFSQADITEPLTTYLDRANEAGYNILFSTALVRPYFRVTHTSDNLVTLAEIRVVLAAYELALQPTEDDTYLVVSIVEPIQAISSDLFDVTERPIEEIVVNSSAHEFSMNHISADVSLDHDDLAKRAVIANDALRVTSRLPGTANNGISSRSSIRGGRENELLINFNGMRLYEPFHLHQFNQLFSVVDGRTIDSLGFITGGFPANYGDRLSGVMNIDTLAAHELEDSREVGLGLYNASYLQSGTIKGDPFFVSIRRSTIDLVLNATDQDFGKPSFSDLHVFYQHDIDSERSLTANLLWFGDDLTINNSSSTEQAQSSFSSGYAWVTYHHNADNGSGSRTTLGFTGIKDDRQGQVNKPGFVAGFLNDDQEFRVYSFDHSQRFRLGDSLLDIGGTYRYLDAEYGFDSALDIDPAYQGISNYHRPTSQAFERAESGQQIGLYTSFKHRLFKPLYLEAGIRLDAQDYISSGWTKQVTPRLSLLYQFPSRAELRLSLGEFSQSQGIHELEASDGETVFQPPQKARHYVLSYTRSFSHIDLRVEAYRKRTSEASYYFENLTDPVSLVPELQIDRTRVAPADVIAEGIEFTLGSQWNKNDFWLNYTRSEVEETIAGATVRRSSDQRHAANAGWSREIRGWQLSVESSYHSGWPTTAISINALGQVNPVVRNDRRLDHYMSVDFKAARQWQLGSNALKLELGITNLLNRDNVIGTEYELIDEQLVATDTVALPIAPFIDLYFSF